MDFLQNLDIEGFGLLLIERAWRLLIILIVAVVFYRVLVWLTHRISRRVERLDGDEDSDFDKRTRTIFRFVRSVGLVIIIIVVVLMVLAEFGVDTTPILASVGVVGLAVGLGAQTLVKDSLGGLFILVEDQFKVGDAIQVNGISGSVEALNFRTTHLRDLSGTLHIIPNGDIRTVANYTRDWARAVVEVNVPYTENVEFALETIREVVTHLESQPSFSSMLQEPLAVNGIEGFEDAGLKFRILGKVESGSQWAVMRILRRYVHEAFVKRGIQMAVPMQRVRVMQPDDLKAESYPEVVEPLYPDEPAPTEEAGDSAESTPSTPADPERRLPPVQRRLIELRQWASERLINPDD